VLPTKQPPKRNADRSVRVASTATEAFFSAASAWAAFARTAGVGSVAAGVGSGGRRQLGRPASLGRTASAWASGSGVGRPASARALGVGSEGGVGYLGRLRLGAAAVGTRRAVLRAARGTGSAGAARRGRLQSVWVLSAKATRTKGGASADGRPQAGLCRVAAGAPGRAALHGGAEGTGRGWGARGGGADLSSRWFTKSAREEVSALRKTVQVGSERFGRSSGVAGGAPQLGYRAGAHLYTKSTRSPSSARSQCMRRYLRARRTV
jgi:hypothetical protein